MDELLVGLALLVSFIFGWNNSSFLIGNLRGSGSLSFTAAVLTSVVGLAAGALLEGSKMVSTLAGSVSPATTSSAMAATLAVSVAVTLALTLVDRPVSFSMVMFGAFLGATSYELLPIDAVRSGTVVAFWFLAPLATALLTAVVYRSTARLVSEMSILAVDSLNRSGALFSGLAVSYTLGANNIGLIYGGTLAGQPVSLAVMLSLVVASVVGVVTLGRNALGGSIGDRMLALSPQGVFSAFVSSALVVWAGTQFAIPVSISQCLLGGMLGAAYSRVISAFNRGLVAETLGMWVLAPLASFGLAYIPAGLL